MLSISATPTRISAEADQASNTAPPAPPATAPPATPPPPKHWSQNKKKEPTSPARSRSPAGRRHRRGKSLTISMRNCVLI